MIILHLDHVSASAQWPHATFIVDRAERAAVARQHGPGAHIKPYLATIERWREINYSRDRGLWSRLEPTYE